jgi:hypothetical protein
VHFVGGVFGDGIISRGLRPVSSPRMNPCEFYLWSVLKDEVYSNSPCTDDLKQNIYDEVSSASPTVL